MTDSDELQYRLTVQQDYDPEGPIQWGRLVSIPVNVITGGHLDSTPDSKDDPLDLRSVMERMAGERGGGIRYRPGLRQYSDHADDVVDAVIRYARIFLGVKVLRWQPQGYSQSAWGDALTYLADANDRKLPLVEQHRFLSVTLGEASAWYRGDVYVVGLDKRVALFDGDGNPRGDTWDSIDALGGCYLDRNYTAADVAREYFDVPEGIDVADLPVIEISPF